MMYYLVVQVAASSSKYVRSGRKFKTNFCLSVFWVSFRDTSPRLASVVTKDTPPSPPLALYSYLGATLEQCLANSQLSLSLSLSLALSLRPSVIYLIVNKPLSLSLSLSLSL